MSDPALSVARLAASYRVQPATEQRRRLDGVLRLVLDEALEPALERAGASIPAELVCIRSVEAPARLALDRHAERELATAWSDAIAAAVAGRVRDGGRDVVRFGSRRHALLDMALCIAAGDREREWAWRLLGLWPATESEAARAVLCALLDDGGAVAPVLGQVARAGVLRALAAALPPAAWLELANAALCSAGASRAHAELALQAGGARAAMPAAVRRALQRSQIAAVLWTSGAPVVAVAALALVEAEPAAVGALGERLAEALPRQLPDRDRPRAPTDVDPERDCDEPLELARRAHGASAFGGLVFALHAVAALDLATRLAAELPAVEPFVALHALALALAADAEPGDPAALAFAGLAPDAFPPPPAATAAFAQPPRADGAAAVICAAAGAVHDWLAARLGCEPDELDRAALLRRRAEITADPGWVEFHLRLDEIDTAPRRAGLDLDPGHLPFLGCVVRIVYA